MPAHSQNRGSWVADNDGQYQTGTSIEAMSHQFNQTNIPSSHAAQGTAWGRNSMTGAGAFSSAPPGSGGFDYRVDPDGYPMNNPYNNPCHDGDRAEPYRIDHKPPSNITDETVGTDDTAIGPNADPNAGLDLNISLTPLIGSPIMSPAHPALTQQNMSLHQRELEQFYTGNLDHWVVTNGTASLALGSRARRHHHHRRGHRAHLSVSSLGSASGFLVAPPSSSRPASSLLSLCGSSFLAAGGSHGGVDGSVYGDEFEHGGEAGTARVAEEDVMEVGTWCG